MGPPECFTYVFNIVLGHNAAWGLSCRNTSIVLMHHRSVNGCCMVRVHLIKLTLNTNARFKLYQQLNASWSKWNGAEVFRTRLRTESDLSKQEQTWRCTALYEKVLGLMSAFIALCVSHVLVTRDWVWIDNWVYWTLITRNYKSL
jgi:hypothetical protein